MISVIIVSFNTKSLTRKCLQSIKVFEDIKNLEIIVVDNNSQDGSVAMIKKGFPFVKLIINNNNLGFAKANNQGIKQAKGDYILLLNSDTEFQSQHTLEKLIKNAQSIDCIGVISPQLLNSDGSIQASVYYFPTVTRALKQYWLGQSGYFGSFIPEGKVPQPVEVVTMAAMLILRSTINKIGLLDEGYFFYYQDLDYCCRIKQEGLKVYYLPSVQIIHHHGKSGQDLAKDENQWRRLIPGSIRYHGLFKHYLIHFILWTGQKFRSRL